MTTVSLLPWHTRCSSHSPVDQALRNPGLATRCAISYLVQRGVVASGERIRVRQGVEIGRQSELYLSAQISNGNEQIQYSPDRFQNGADEKEFRVDEANLAGVVDVRIAGSTVLVATGRLFLP